MANRIENFRGHKVVSTRPTIDGEVVGSNCLTIVTCPKGFVKTFISTCPHQARKRAFDHVARRTRRR